ncbi:MAG: hypothetical protein EOP50_00055 [Sphingobacteriales bacterium]|nr:MAG: hypothetical protein EOP50_00055 [Sphingobacteriales bacterium]
MKHQLLIGRTCLFAAAFFPLHVAPPVLSDQTFSDAMGSYNNVGLTLAYHVGFALAAVLMLIWGALARAIVGRWKLFAPITLIAGFATLTDISLLQVFGRLGLGGSAVVLLAGFYRNLKIDNGYHQLPMIFGLSALFLESGGLIVGLVVKNWGFRPALGLSWSFLAAASVCAVVLLREKNESSKVLEAVRFDFSGSTAFMGVAVLAYGGFFLMLLSLSTLAGLPDGPIISGLAIFSTAFAFSAGNLIPFEKIKWIGSPAQLVLFGTLCSTIGSALVWHGIVSTRGLMIVSGAATVAFGNGITVSRCFQRASLVSSDGYSGSILTMLGVMVLTVVLTIGSETIGASAPIAQLLAFLLAFTVIFAHGITNAFSSHRV